MTVLLLCPPLDTAAFLYYNEENIFSSSGGDFMDPLILSTLLGSLFGGAFIGAIPAICGAVKRKRTLAIAGFVTCIASSLLLGLILSLPTCAVFTFFIFKKSKPAEKQ